MGKRKNTSSSPKKLKGRERRLATAPTWLASNENSKPSNLLKRYRKRFGVDWECAITELKELGVVFDETYLKALRATLTDENGHPKPQRPISRFEFDCAQGIPPQSDDEFAFIAGCTAGGVPYGITWEEMENDEANERRPGRG